MTNELIDVHAHWFPPALAEKFGELGGPKVWPLHEPTLSERLDLLEQEDVALQVLSLGHNQPAIADKAAAVEGARWANDLYAAAVDGQARVSAFGSLPLPHVEESIAEARRVLEDLGFAGINLGTTALGRSLDDEGYEQLWSYLNEAKAAVFIHPVGTPDTFTSGMETHLIGPKFGGPHEAGLTVIRLMAADFSSRFPDVKLIIAPMGGTVSLLWRRFEEMGASIGQPPYLGDDAVGRLRSFYFDTTLTDDPKVLRFVADEVGVDRLVLGTDCPRVGIRDWASRTVSGLALDPAGTESVFATTAKKLLQR